MNHFKSGWLAIGLISVSAFFAGALASYANSTAAASIPETAVIEVKEGKKTLGKIKIKLFPDKAPVTVKNFVDLAEGKRTWTDPKTGKKVNRSLYKDTKFHRVIKNFMIQGGDPLGTGTGGPGYRFADEITSDTFSKKGILAMANAGKNTNGSQFFITVKPTPWLNAKHTIFGEVTEGQDVVDKISLVKTGPGDVPVTDVVISDIKITYKKSKK